TCDSCLRRWGLEGQTSGVIVLRPASVAYSVGPGSGICKKLQDWQAEYGCPCSSTGKAGTAHREDFAGRHELDANCGCPECGANIGFAAVIAKNPDKILFVGFAGRARAGHEVLDAVLVQAGGRGQDAAD